MSNSAGIGVILLTAIVVLVWSALLLPVHNACTADYDAGRARGISTTLSMLDAVSIRSGDLREMEEELDR